MNVSDYHLPIVDNGGARTRLDRRQHAEIDYHPEKRTGVDRRKGSDRRGSPGRKRGWDSGAVERRDVFRKSD
jgi:hypothetical protein